jgi:chitinase/chitodextrinase
VLPPPSALYLSFEEDFAMKRLAAILALIVCLAFCIQGLVTTQAQSYPAWAPNTAFKIGDMVTYQDATHPNHLYKCIQAHTSLTGWEPPNVPALWQDMGAYSGGGATNTPTNTSVPPTVTLTPSKTPTSGGMTPTKTNTAVPTATASGGSCYTPYVNGTVYVGGNQVSYNGHNWQAKWWTQNEYPSTGGSGVWADLGSCTGGLPTNTPTFVPPTATPTQAGPTNTPTKTFTPCSNCGGSLPRHVLTGYWQNFSNGAQVLRLRDVPTTYGLIAVAFADATGTAGAVTFNLDSGLASALGGYTIADFTSDISTLHSQGRKVIISVGGQNGSISVSDSTSATNFANSVYSLITQYGFDGVDIDLENGINPTYMANALQQLSGKAGSSLIITLAPQTIDMQSTSAGYFQLALNIKSILTIVNMQYYNSGSMLGCDGKVYSQGSVDFLTALACIQLQGGLRPDQIGLGLPASPSGAGSGYVSPSIVNNALDCLELGTNCGSFKPSATYSGIRGAMDWSINWDASAGYAFSNAVTGHFASLP